jgi:hypothetical protein
MLLYLNRYSISQTARALSQWVMELGNSYSSYYAALRKGEKCRTFTPAQTAFHCTSLCARRSGIDALPLRLTYQFNCSALLSQVQSDFFFCFVSYIFHGFFNRKNVGIHRMVTEFWVHANLYQIMGINGIQAMKNTSWLTSDSNVKKRNEFVLLWVWLRPSFYVKNNCKWDISQNC